MFIKVTIIRKYKENGDEALATDPWSIDELPQFLNLEVVEAFRFDEGKMRVIYKNAENDESQSDELKNSLTEIETKLLKLGVLL